MEPVTMAAAAGGMGYADSVDSSPRSRGGESWDEPFSSSAAAAASRLRLMCSYGGRIVPRPTDRSLCYLGGETRIVVVDRHSSLADLSAKLSRSLLGGSSFSLKYQLPNEDLDSLISVTTDEDLDNMIEEYDRIIQSSAGAVGPGGGGGNIGSTRSNRLRLFLFPSKPESNPSSIGSLLDDSKSETWFVDALNSAMGIGIDGLSPGLSADSASVNCLLGLEDDSSTHSRGIGGGGPGVAATSEPEQLILPRPDSSGKLARQGQDVHSVPDSPMLDTTSSFGSTSSAPSLSNLPPIRVRPEDRPPDQRIGGLEDHLAHMNLSSAPVVVSGHRPDEGYKDSNFPPYHPPPPPIPLPTASASTPTISPTENSSRVFSDDEKSDHGGVRKQPPPPQPKPTPIDAPISDSTTRPMYYPERASSAPTAINPVSEPRRELPVSADPSYRVSMPVPDSSYVLPPVPPEQFQQQQQFIPANHHYIHHPATGTVVPVSSYYPIAHPIQQPQQAHHYDPQIPMYYLPVRQNPQHYNLAAVPPNLADSTAAKPTVSLPRAPVKPELQANLFRTAAPSAQPAQAAPPLIHLAADQVPHQYAGVGYHVMHHHPSQAPQAMANYGYEYADPAHAQLYYSQAGSAPQYQKFSAAAMPDALPGDVKQARAS